MPEISMRRALIAVALVIVLIVALVLPLGSVPASERPAVRAASHQDRIPGRRLLAAVRRGAA